MKLHRIQQIEEYVKHHGSVSLDDLCQRFQVSKNTIRRDIQDLEGRQIVKKVYGGVVVNKPESPIPLSQRQMTMQPEKTRIARKAAEFVNDGDILLIDAGSTTAHLIEHVTDRRDLTIITNSIPVLSAALAYDQVHVLVTGGDLLRSTNSLIGPDAAAMLNNLNAHTAFLAATSVSLEKGVTNSTTFEVEIKKTMMAVSAQRILLVDHTKFDTVSLVTFAELRELDVLITDAAPPAPYFDYCAAHDVEIVVAPA